MAREKAKLVRRKKEKGNKKLKPLSLSITVKPRTQFNDDITIFGLVFLAKFTESLFFFLWERGRKEVFPGKNMASSLTTHINNMACIYINNFNYLNITSYYSLFSDLADILF